MGGHRDDGPGDVGVLAHRQDHVGGGPHQQDQQADDPGQDRPLDGEVGKDHGPARYRAAEKIQAGIVNRFVGRDFKPGPGMELLQTPEATTRPRLETGTDLHPVVLILAHLHLALLGPVIVADHPDMVDLSLGGQRLHRDEEGLWVSFPPPGLPGRTCRVSARAGIWDRRLEPDASRAGRQGGVDRGHPPVKSPSSPETVKCTVCPSEAAYLLLGEVEIKVQRIDLTEVDDRAARLDEGAEAHLAQAERPGEGRADAGVFEVGLGLRSWPRPGAPRPRRSAAAARRAPRYS